MIHCPNCHKDDPIPDQPLLNVESYGGKTCITHCKHCKAPLIADIERTIIVRSIEIGKHEFDDWGYETKRVKGAA